MRFTLNRTSRLLPVVALTLACSCAGPANIAPPAADLSILVEPKPVPAEDIAVSQQAYDDYQASVEGWGDRKFLAGTRLCQWSQRVYRIKVPGCPR